jgi:hypothetical protein
MPFLEQGKPAEKSIEAMEAGRFRDFCLAFLPVYEIAAIPADVPGPQCERLHLWLRSEWAYRWQASHRQGTFVWILGAVWAVLLVVAPL